MSKNLRTISANVEAISVGAISADDADFTQRLALETRISQLEAQLSQLAAEVSFLIANDKKLSHQ